jgi:hypothetical protein
MNRCLDSAGGGAVQASPNSNPNNHERHRQFDRRTVGLILDPHRRGVLPEALLLALLAGIGLPADEGDSQ